MSTIPIRTISLPDYRAHADTDWLAEGQKLDRLIEAEFPRRRIAIRGIGLIDHPDRSLEDLVSIVVRLGTDRYDPDREGLHYGRVGTDDICASPASVTDRGLRSSRSKDKQLVSMMANVLELFYEGALADRGYAVRLDLLMIYDLDQLEPILDFPPEECCEFTFKDPAGKRSALIGLVKIQR